LLLIPAQKHGIAKRQIHINTELFNNPDVITHWDW
jgi:hypothetical protein